MHCKANGLRIVGYYEANERLDDEALSLVGQKITSQILHVQPDAFAVVVSNIPRDKAAPFALSYCGIHSGSNDDLLNGLYEFILSLFFQLNA